MSDFLFAQIGNADCRETFRQWKRKAWSTELATVSGEWAQSPYHQGLSSFQLSTTADGQFVRARFIRAVPSPVVLVAKLLDPGRLAEVLPAIIAAVNRDTPYAWPTDFEYEILDSRISPKNLRPSKTAAEGKIASDADDHRLANRRKARLAKAEINVAQQQELLQKKRVAGVQKALQGLLSVPIEDGREIAWILSEANREVLDEAIHALRRSQTEIAAALRRSANELRAEAPRHRSFAGYNLVAAGRLENVAVQLESRTGSPVDVVRTAKETSPPNDPTS